MKCGRTRSRSQAPVSGFDIERTAASPPRDVRADAERKSANSLLNTLAADGCGDMCRGLSNTLARARHAAAIPG